MKVYRGIAVSEGYAIGPVRYLSSQKENVPLQKTENRPQEWSRFLQARMKACSRMMELYQQALSRVGEHYAGIFKIQLALLQDEDLLTRVRRRILEEGYTAESAIEKTADEYRHLFEEMDDEYLRAREADVQDVKQQVLMQLASSSTLESRRETSPAWEEPCILAADDILPSETLHIDASRVRGMILRKGSQISHAAILARSLGIPAVAGVTDLPQSDDLFVIVDGFSGEILADPPKEKITAYAELQSQYEAQRQALKQYSDVKTVTLDGTPVELMANIGHPNDLTGVLDYGADGIGLFRSEYLFMYCDQMPSEEQQAAAYGTVLQQMKGKRVVIRLLNIGADKQVPYVKMDREENPVMGRRGIRFCLEHRDILMTQLRALLRAARLGKLGILIPMVVSGEEIHTVRRLLTEAARELKQEGLAYSDDYELGIMIETPASVMLSPELAREVDFFSIGTNDLTQFVMAADRGNPKVGALCQAGNEAVRRMVRIAVDSARQAGIWVDVCGEAAADPELTEFLLKIGVRSLSVAPPSLLVIRQRVRQIDLSKRKEGKGEA